MKGFLQLLYHVDVPKGHFDFNNCKLGELSITQRTSDHQASLQSQNAHCLGYSSLPDPGTSGAARLPG